MIALSRAIEEEAMARAAGPVVIARLPGEPATTAPSSTATGGSRGSRMPWACSPTSTRRASSAEDEPAEIRIGPTDALGHEWAVVIDAPGYAACLIGWETPVRGEDRIFEAVWTMDAAVVRRAAQVGATLAARHAPEWSERLIGLLADRPLAVESPTPGLTALTNRMIGYLDAQLRPGNPADRPLEDLTADGQADLRQLARGQDGGGDELRALGRAERLGRRLEAGGAW